MTSTPIRTARSPSHTSVPLALKSQNNVSVPPLGLKSSSNLSVPPLALRSNPDQSGIKSTSYNSVPTVSPRDLSLSGISFANINMNDSQTPYITPINSPRRSRILTPEEDVPGFDLINSPEDDHPLISKALSEEVPLVEPEQHSKSQFPSIGKSFSESARDQFVLIKKRISENIYNTSSIKINKVPSENVYNTSSIRFAETLRKKDFPKMSRNLSDSVYSANTLKLDKQEIRPISGEFSKVPITSNPSENIYNTGSIKIDKMKSFKLHNSHLNLSRNGSESVYNTSSIKIDRLSREIPRLNALKNLNSLFKNPLNSSSSSSSSTSDNEKEVKTSTLQESELIKETEAN